MLTPDGEDVLLAVSQDGEARWRRMRTAFFPEFEKRLKLASLVGSILRACVCGDAATALFFFFFFLSRAYRSTFFQFSWSNSEQGQHGTEVGGMDIGHAVALLAAGVIAVPIFRSWGSAPCLAISRRRRRGAVRFQAVRRF